MQNGTITITNVGVFGVDTGTPILNPGESAILAVGAIKLQPWVHKGKVKPRHVTTLALSFDHRLIDGELGSRFLADIAAVLEHPRDHHLVVAAPAHRRASEGPLATALRGAFGVPEKSWPGALPGVIIRP